MKNTARFAAASLALFLALHLACPVWAAAPKAAEAEAKPAPTVYRNTIKGNQDVLGPAISEICKRYNVTGASVAAFEKDRIVYLQSYGTANREAGLAVNRDTKYRVASISKMVTAMLALMLQERSAFNIDDDLRQRIPALSNAYYPNTPVTTRQLMLHTSGLFDGRGYLDAISGNRFPSLREVLRVGGVWTGSQPGTRYVYTNFGAGLMAGAIESATGQRFYDYAKAALFDPLGVDAGYSVSLIENKAAIASIYSGGVRTAAPSQWGNMSAAYSGIAIGEMYLLGQGELVISAEDLARIGIILAGNGTYKDTKYLAPESLAQMNSVQFADEAQNIARGLGTMSVAGLLPETRVYGHQGNAYGMISGIFYDPVSQTGVVVLTNGCSAAQDANGVYAVNREVMREVWRYLGI